MCKTETFKQLEKLFSKYNLGELNSEPKQITGGLLHKMYGVNTKENNYALKELNPSIMKRTGVAEKLINSERVAKALKEIVPAVTAIQFDDNPLLTLDGKYYMVFQWLDGMSIFPPNITLENCRMIGKLLGKIHTSHIIIPNMQKELSVPELYEWNSYLLLGQESSAPWTEELSLIIDDLKRWNETSKEAYISLSEHMVLSHRDLDPKNVMWNDGNPYIIDWESAGYINPYQELLEVLNYWANNGMGEIDKDKFMELYHAYIEIAGSFQVNFDKVLSSGFLGMLGWLNYSFKRSLGIEASSVEEKNLGTEQVFVTIKALRQYSKQIQLVKYWIKKG
jgi:Ser/Thr protein kinase RdoA (MazF antagonist)